MDNQQLREAVEKAMECLAACSNLLRRDGSVHTADAADACYKALRAALTKEAPEKNPEVGWVSVPADVYKSLIGLAMEVRLQVRGSCPTWQYAKAIVESFDAELLAKIDAATPPPKKEGESSDSSFSEPSKSLDTSGKER